MKGSLIIVGFFVLGTLCGVFHLIPIDIVVDSKVSFYALCALMFSVGLSVGNDPQTLKNFRSLNPRLIFLPIMTILGTLAGSAAVSLILTHRSLMLKKRFRFCVISRTSTKIITMYIIQTKPLKHVSS